MVVSGVWRELWFSSQFGGSGEACGSDLHAVKLCEIGAAACCCCLNFGWLHSSDLVVSPKLFDWTKVSQSDSSLRGMGCGVVEGLWDHE